MDLADRFRSRVPDGALIRGLHSAAYLVEYGRKRPIFLRKDKILKDIAAGWHG